jgi:hypothetical protein
VRLTPGRLSAVACACLGLLAGGCTPHTAPAAGAGWGTARQISASPTLTGAEMRLAT